jgi:hypothetical protein
MNVSKKFIQDFAYIANLYAWSVADIEDVKAQTRASPAELGRYWTRLAAAHRAGYQQTGANNFMRLGHWEQTSDRTAPAEFRDQYAPARTREAN